jgi:hypothetical protein
VKRPAIKKSFVIHPFLFAIFPILVFYAYNMAELSFSVTLLPLAFASGFALLLLALSWLILRNVRKAGIVVSIFLILFFSYGYAIDLVWGWGVGNFNIRGVLVGTPARYVLLIWAALFVGGAYLTIRTHRDFRNLTIILNVVAVTLVLVPSISIGAYELKRPSIAPEDTTAAIVLDPGETDTLPDIYYIVLDAYASAGVLEEIFDFDNSEFIDYLTEKGFYVASESRSNYKPTRFSLASSLNMKYVNTLIDEVRVGSKDMRILTQMVKDNLVTDLARSVGYKYIHFATWLEPTLYNEHADMNIRCDQKKAAGLNLLSEFNKVLIQTTLLRVFEKQLLFAGYREYVLQAFDKLAEMPGIQGPKFVFAHIICPHAPYVFGADGEPIEVTDWRLDSASKQREKYLNQLQFVNKKVEVFVDEILSKSETPPIIILQADHGPRFACAQNECSRKETLEDRFGILNAYYLPQGGDDLLYQSISPVNTFRVVFNFYFGASFELLSDESYDSPPRDPYNLVNVTEELEELEYD